MTTTTWPSSRPGAKIREGTARQANGSAGILAPVIAEPQPAELPLPGGREGATVACTRCCTGSCPARPAWFHREDGPARRAARARVRGRTAPTCMRHPVPAFLVEHPGAGPMLIDTGFHPSVAVDPKQNLGRLLAYDVPRASR